MNPFFVKIALLENGRLAEIHIREKDSLIGNVYLAKVTKVIPGIEGAFVDIGWINSAFLYLNEPSQSPVKQGDLVVVQVEKDESRGKGPIVTRKISIPGDYTVVFKGCNVAVSSKIENEYEREKLKEVLKSILPDGFGSIVRTSGKTANKEALVEEVNKLVNIIDEIDSRSNRYDAPSLLYKECNFTDKLIRDVLSRNVTEIVVNEISEYMRLIQSHPFIKIRLYEKKYPLFSEYSIEKEIANSLSPKVWLKSGGYIIIEETNALVAIDVNSGKAIGKKSLLKTAKLVNNEAAEEIAKQIRLRNLSGMIVVDFIEIQNQDDKKELLNYFTNLVKNDRVKTIPVSIVDLGLMIVTRKKTTEPLSKTTLKQNSTVNQFKNYSTIYQAHLIYNVLEKKASNNEFDKINVFTTSEISHALKKQVRIIEEKYDKKIRIVDNGNDFGYKLEVID